MTSPATETTLFSILLTIAMLSIAMLSIAMCGALPAAEIRVIEEGGEPIMRGKELDWIYGDSLMRNDRLTLVIAAPRATRDANMTIRKIGASILDLSLNDPSNDQLSAFTPTAGRYWFHDPSLVTTGRDGDDVFWQCRSSRTIAQDGTTAVVRYSLADRDPFVEVTVRIEGGEAEKIVAFDGVRADGWFSFEQQRNLAYCSDSFFRQTIGFQVPGNPDPPTWKRGRPYQLRYLQNHVERSESGIAWTLRIYPATSLVDLAAVAERPEKPARMHRFEVITPMTPVEGVDSVNRAQIQLRSGEEKGETSAETYALRTNDAGIAHARLQPGKYIATASAIGYEDVDVPFDSTGGETRIVFPMAAPGGFDAEVTDGQGQPIPVKATLYTAGDKQPDFGLSSARTFVENLVYSVHGKFRCPLDPGTYEVIFSRGPEYQIVSRKIEVSGRQWSTMQVQLDRVVDTTGWISADLHSHSSPSGDNTSDQYGRVENLLCEQVEFAPCTEHNRVSSYAPHLRQMKLSHLMATCTGIELTGSPTPVNHQNAFPLHHHPHTQNGGGPRAASNPVIQIERLAMWDESSDKLVQMNHPNLHQIYGDLDLDETPDRGFRGMFEFTDVVEVHPLETIFQDVPNNPPTRRRAQIRLFQWLQLLNQGYRIPGVINTDSHYNHHGSGWRRNWIASRTDDPAQVSTDEIVDELEKGHVIMSTGPFLSVEGTSASESESVLPGDDLAATDGEITLNVRVQCPNWLDVNRVQVFINGRPSEQYHYTRKESPERFGELDAIDKFQASIGLSLDEDAHVIVACIGEGMTMEKVMGSRYGRRPPMAVSNPIFVDVDGNGFQHNHDLLDSPLPGAP